MFAKMMAMLGYVKRSEIDELQRRAEKAEAFARYVADEARDWALVIGEDGFSADSLYVDRQVIICPGAKNVSLRNISFDMRRR